MATILICIFYYYTRTYIFFAIIIANFFGKHKCSTIMYTDLLWIVRFAASSTTAGDTSGPTDALSSTETTGTEIPTTSGDVTVTFVSTSGGKYFIINNYLYS